MTVKSLPGDKPEQSVYVALLALFYPYMGIWRGFQAIANRTPLWGMNRKRNDLRIAAQTGALCVLVRKKNWMPAKNDVIHGCQTVGINSTEHKTPLKAALLLIHSASVTGNRIDPKSVQIRGQYPKILPEVYEFAVLPANINVAPKLSHAQHLSRSTNFVKTLVSILQIGFACTILYRTRGQQLEKYGYATHGFTVVPYTAMSVINLMGSLLTPDFPAIYMVRSEVMDKAEARAGKPLFSGTVASLSMPDSTSGVQKSLRFVEIDPTVVSSPDDVTSTETSRATDYFTLQPNNGLAHALLYPSQRFHQLCYGCIWWVLEKRKDISMFVLGIKCLPSKYGPN